MRNDVKVPMDAAGLSKWVMRAKIIAWVMAVGSVTALAHEFLVGYDSNGNFVLGVFIAATAVWCFISATLLTVLRDWPLASAAWVLSIVWFGTMIFKFAEAANL